MQELKYLKTARFSGPQAEEFLQAQLSADMGALGSGESTFACYCSPRGQVYGLLLVCRTEQGFLVAGSDELLPGILQRLRMFVFRSQVEFSIDEALSVYGYQDGGPGNLEDMSFTPGNAGLHYRFAEEGLGEAREFPAFRRLEVLNQVSWLNERTTEKFIPQMLGFDQLGAISFSKGCYPGQEIVARARYLGKVKRKPHVVAIEQALSIDAAERVEIRKNDSWVNGTVLDSYAGGNEATLLLIIAASEPEAPVSELRYQDRVYRCATI